jgi:SAM-dependent methyltransferase
VIGVERDAKMVEAARSILRSADREDVAVIQADVTKSGLDPASFDLVHCRYLLPHVPDARVLLVVLINLAKPGGVVLVQEPDHSSWNFYPTIPAWPRLIQLGEQAFARAGVEINIGRHTFQMLREAGLEQVTVEACVLALQDAHPYKGMGLTAVESLRPLMLKAGLTTETELDDLVREVEEHMARPDTCLITFTTTQVWGRRRR